MRTGPLGRNASSSLTRLARASRFVLAAWFLLAFFYAGQLLWSEWQIQQGTAASLYKMPSLGDERVWLALAHLTSEREVPLLETALRVNPRDSAGRLASLSLRERE